MRSMRNQAMNDGNSKRTRELDLLQLLKSRQFFSVVMTETSTRWLLRPGKRNGELRQEAQSSHRRLSLIELPISAAPMVIFTLLI